jgi:hypothetical protein
MVDQLLTLNRASATFPAGRHHSTQLTAIFQSIAHSRNESGYQIGPGWSIPTDASKVRIEQKPEAVDITFIAEPGSDVTLELHKHHVFSKDTISRSGIFNSHYCYPSATGNRLVVNAPTEAHSSVDHSPVQAVKPIYTC